MPGRLLHRDSDLMTPRRAGIDFGSSPGQRLTWLVEAVAAMRRPPSWTASS